MENTNREKLQNIIDNEHERFYKEKLARPKEVIYADAYEISFTEEYYELFMSDMMNFHLSDEYVDILVRIENPLSFIYSAWMDSSISGFNHDWEDMCDFIITEVIPAAKDYLEED